VNVGPPWQWKHSNVRSLVLVSKNKASPLVAIVRRVARDQAALEAGDRARDEQLVEGLGFLRKRGAKQLSVLGITAQTLRQLFFHPGQTQLDGLRAEQWNGGLYFEVGEQWIGPGESRGIGEIREAHGAARVHLASRAEADGTAIREGELLLVAARARLLLVGRQTLVVEEMAAELDLLRAEWIDVGDEGFWKMGRER
jgi:hypothetical protein